MAQKRNPASRIIDISDEEDEEEEQPCNSSSDGEEDDEEEVEEDDEEEVEEGDEEEVEEDDEEEVEEEVEEEEEEEGEEDDEEEVEEEEVEEDDDYDLKQDVEDEEEEFSSKESIRKLLEPLGRDRLVEIFKEAALKNPALISRVVSSYDSDPVHRKIFVHGLATDTTSDAVSAAFSPFGEIENCRIISNPRTGLCKGYAFVLFKSRAAATRALKDPLKQIGSRTANCHLASSGPQTAGGKSSSETAGRKIIVNNVSNKLKTEDLRSFFSTFGEIEEGPLGHDPVSGKLRGVAFFIYKTVEGCKKALEEPKKRFDGCEMHCRMVFEGDKMNNNTLMAALAGTQRMSSGLRANDLTKKNASSSTLMGHNSGHAPTPWTGQNLSSRPTLLARQNFGPVQTTLMGQSISPGLSSFVGQNGGSGHFNMAPALCPPLSVGSGVTPAQSYGVVSANRSSGLGPNDISSSVINKYGTLSALYGMGAYQNSTSTTALKPQSGVGSLGTSHLPPFFGL